MPFFPTMTRALAPIRRLLPLLIFPLACVAAGAMLVQVPRMLFACLLVGLAWLGWRRWTGRGVPPLGLDMPRSGFPVPIAAGLVVLHLLQALSAFLAGISLVAGWPVMWLLPYALGPSWCLAAGLEVRRHFRQY